MAKGLLAHEVRESQLQHGLNQLDKATTVSRLALFAGQFKDFMVLVLLIATAISALLGEWLDSITILAIIVVNALFGFIQEQRAERSLQALQRLTAPTALVIRDGKQQLIQATEVTVGDLVILAAGDRIPADLKFLQASGVAVDESALTGESEPVSKEQGSVAFLGTMMTRGSGQATVTAIGMQTEMGRIAHLLNVTESAATPLQRRLAQLGRWLIVIALVLTALVVVFGVWHGQPLMAMFLAGVSLAVAAIPEGLPAIVTVALALGVQRMIKRRAITRKLQSVETLGSATVICSDKTGTLTQNRMTVTKLWISERYLNVTGEGYAPVGDVLDATSGQRIDPREDAPLRRLIQIAALCNNATVVQDTPPSSGRKKGAGGATKSSWTLLGDPTEGALTVLSLKLGMDQSALSSLYSRAHEYPFDASRKRMSVIVKHQGGQLICSKGAADLLIERCTYVLWAGHVVPLKEEHKRIIRKAADDLAKQALRVIGFAYRDLRLADSIPPDESTAERQLVFVGLSGMIDPPRPEVPAAIQICRRAGIRPVMITGDHALTASAIGREIGIVSGADHPVVTGQQLDQLDDAQLEKLVQGETNVYARVTPEHKLRIVQALQRAGHIVAMTGDGVNDAPALKAADIGIAMGMNGTDVAKEASALVLSDDNFATIIAAVEEGRSIYENIRKFIRYLLASNVGEIMTMLLASMAGLPLPLVPIQILWVNLVTDGLPAIALGVDQAEKELMQQPPRPPQENIFARRLGWKVLSRGIMIGLCTLGAFALTYSVDQGEGRLIHAQTVAFATLVLAQLIHVFDCRSSRSIFHRNLLENKFLVVSVISSLALVLGVIYYEPLQPIFRTMPLDWTDWSLAVVAAGIPTFLLGMGSVLGGRKASRPWRQAVQN